MANELMPLPEAQKIARERMAKSMPNIVKMIPEPAIRERLPTVLDFVLAKKPELSLCPMGQLVSAVVECAWLGFEPEVLGRCWIVPWKQKGKYFPQVMIGYQGYCDLAMRSDRVSKIWGNIVYSNDEFDEDLAGGGAAMVHRRAVEGERGREQAIGAYARYRTVVGGIETAPVGLYMTRKEIMAHKAMSSGARSRHSPWNSEHWEIEQTMWLKCPIRKMYKTMPKSVHMIRAVALEQQAEQGERQVYELDMADGAEVVADIAMEQDLDKLEQELGDG